MSVYWRDPPWKRSERVHPVCPFEHDCDNVTLHNNAWPVLKCCFSNAFAFGWSCLWPKLREHRLWPVSLWLVGAGIWLCDAGWECLQRRRSHNHTLGQSPSSPRGWHQAVSWLHQGESRRWLKWIEASLANIGKSAPIWDCKSPDCCLSRRSVQVNERTISQLKRPDRKIWYLEVNRTFVSGQLLSLMTQV